MRKMLAPVAAALMALPMGAHAADVITFDGLAQASTHFIAGPYSEKGLTFEMSNSFGFFSWGSGAAANADPGGATLAPGFYGTLTIRSAHGTTFDLAGFDIADLMNNGSGGPLVYGYDAGAGSLAGLLNLDLAPGLQSVALNLTGLKRFTIVATAPGIQIDNVAFTLGTSAVPEPANWAMLIGGCGLVGGVLRRRHAGRAVTA